MTPLTSSTSRLLLLGTRGRLPVLPVRLGFEGARYSVLRGLSPPPSDAPLGAADTTDDCAAAAGPAAAARKAAGLAEQRQQSASHMQSIWLRLKAGCSSTSMKATDEVPDTQQPSFAAAVHKVDCATGAAVHPPAAGAAKSSEACTHESSKFGVTKVASSVSSYWCTVHMHEAGRSQLLEYCGQPPPWQQ